MLHQNQVFFSLYLFREHKEWKLHINSVQELDRGWYMCQVGSFYIKLIFYESKFIAKVILLPTYTF